MFTINYKNTSGAKKNISIIDKEYAIITFNLLLESIDLDEIFLIDGLTGEILFAVKDHKFIIFDSITIRG